MLMVVTNTTLDFLCKVSKSFALIAHNVVHVHHKTAATPSNVARIAQGAHSSHVTSKGSFGVVSQE